jgi:2-oxoglutarate dehydrogenase E2 component (dihydrolipoamide succinyltransferase)
MDIKIPEVGESVFEALVGKWLKQDGETVAKNEPLCEVETDKITFEINADTDGVLHISVAAGTTVKIGTVIGIITEGAGAKPASALSPTEKRVTAHTTPSARKKEREDQTASPAPVAPPQEESSSVKSEEFAPYNATPPGRETRIPMTPIRKRIAERLLKARQQTVMLTTFNEADMSRIMELRSRHKDHFLQKHGVKLGFMSFFVKACVEALKDFPAVNASIDESDIVFHHYYDIGIAIGGEKGLVVPILRNADQLHFWEIEQRIEEFGRKVKENKLAIADLAGGTFTITNGGVYGSLLSTPVLNPPQSGVLGMHAIQERPVVRDGQIVIRPMMNLALSYDHRIIDGREAVSFLKRMKELVEDPEELFLEG